MNTLQRIKEYIDFKGITNQKFEKEIGFSNGAFATQLKNNKTIGVDKLENILIAYPEINPEWLLTGQGQMLKRDKSVESVITDKEKGYPLVNATAIGGVGNSVFAFTDRDVKAYYKIPKFNHKKVDFMIEVEGSSMYPKYNSGDVVACTIIKESAFIQWNKTHVVATQEQGIIIKRIKKGSAEDSLTMISDNDSYDPFEVPKNEITGMALVVGVIRLE